MMIMMVIPPDRLLNLIGLEGRASGFSATRSERLLSQLSALTQTERVHVSCVFMLNLVPGSFIIVVRREGPRPVTENPKAIINIPNPIR